MMHGHEKSDLAIVAEKPVNKAEQPAAKLVERRAGTTRGTRASKARTGHREGSACHRRWNAYGMSLPSHTRGGSRMRESRPYGSVRGARDETRVPTATQIDCRLKPESMSWKTENFPGASCS